MKNKLICAGEQFDGAAEIEIAFFCAQLSNVGLHFICQTIEPGDHGVINMQMTPSSESLSLPIPVRQQEPLSRV